MNRIIKGLGIALGCVLIASSCSEISFGDKFLGDQPESSGATTEEMFSSKINAEKVLTKAYTGLPYGLPTGSDYKLGVNILESITDLCYSFRDNISDGPVKLYYNGALSANNVPKNSAYRYGSKSDWTTIRYAWLYIENVEKVPDMTASEKSERIAEAKVLISLCYFEMLRYVGGVTWLDHYVDVNETMNFPRITFAETVEKIVGLLNEAINSNLAWKAEKADDGRMTLAGAMALKFKVLQWAASPTFNSNTKWHPEADEYTCYGNYSDQRWKDAAEAGAAFYGLPYSENAHETALIRWGNSLAEFDWDFLTPRRFLPRMAVMDLDGDGKDELIVLTYVGSGTGVSIYDLHVLEKNPDGTLTDYAMPGSLWQERLPPLLRFVQTDGRNFLILGRELLEIDMEHVLEGQMEPSAGWIANFRLLPEEHAIQLLGAVDLWKTTNYVADYTADVGYRDGVFTLSGFHLQ